jgi:hypothetical protein
MPEFNELGKSISSVNQLKKYVYLASDESQILEKIIESILCE